MGLEIKTFVHGASRGHKMWPEAPDEKSYTVKFYSTSWNFKESMLVEVRTNNNIPYCYYSFIRGGEVHGADDRPESYFAITLRMNTCYTDLQNMYHLLRAAYEKVCVGMCIEEHDSFAQITTDDFSEKEEELKRMQKGLVDYIFQFSQDSDLASLNGFQRSNGSTGLKVNDAEARGALVLNALKRTGRVVVSHLIDTSKVAEVRKQADLSMQQCQADATRRIQQAQANAAASIEQAKKNCANEKQQLEQDLQQERQKVRAIRQEMQCECDRQIKDIKAQYASADKKMSDLRRVIEQKDGEIKQWNSKVSDQAKQIDKKDKRIKELEAQLKPKIGGEEVINKSWIDTFMHSKQALVGAFIVLALTLFFFVSQIIILCHTWGSDDAKQVPATITATVPGDIAPPDTTETDAVGADDADETTGIASPDEIERYKKLYTFRIDVKEFVNGKKTLKPNEHATISLKVMVMGANKQAVPIEQLDWLKGMKLTADSMEVNEPAVAASQPGKYTLVYKVGGTEIAHREIEVK